MADKLTHFNDRSIPPKMQSKPRFFRSCAMGPGPDLVRRAENCFQVPNSTAKPSCRREETATYAWAPLSKTLGLLAGAATHPIVYSYHGWKHRVLEYISLELWPVEKFLN